MAGLNILIVDDELNIRKTIAYCIRNEGHFPVAVGSSSEAIEEASMQCFDLAFIDLRLGEDNGMDLIPQLLSVTPWMKIIIITAHASIKSAVEAIKLGAVDYIQKPFTPGQIILLVKRIQRLRSMELELKNLREQSKNQEPGNIFYSGNSHMKRILETARKAASSEAIVVLTGESGTGKSVLAKAIHQWSPRAKRPFNIVSCPAMPVELLESELFGHVRGAFTGAEKDNPGRIAFSEGGTLFLDEIADLPISIQPKILQLIQDKTYHRVGDPKLRKADVRIIAATNANLEENIKNGTFREDLYYRLSVISIQIPPLREHKEDILPLAEEFLEHFSSVNHKKISSIDEDAKKRLLEYSWPGNIRELCNTIERAVILGPSNAVNSNFLPLSHNGNENGTQSINRPNVGDPLSLAEIEKMHIKQVLARSVSIQEAASVLGIDQATLWRKRRNYNIK